MKEIIAVILSIIGIICLLKVMSISGKHRNIYDSGSIFEREYNHHKRLLEVPGFIFWVFFGLACFLLSMYFLGMLGNS